MAKRREPSEAALKALEHPLRCRIVKLLAGGEETELSPVEVARELDWPLSNVSYHVRVLAACEALTLSRTQPVRGSVQHFYKASRAFVTEPTVAGLLELPPQEA